MLKPSYAELMDVMNSESEEKVVTSRYTIVIAAAKRARQLIDGDEPMADMSTNSKPVSIAVEELREGKIKVVPEGEGTILNLHKNIEVDLDLISELKETMPVDIQDKKESNEDLLEDDEEIDEFVDFVDEDVEE